jgi:hypothetical protein
MLRDKYHADTLNLNTVVPFLFLIGTIAGAPCIHGSATDSTAADSVAQSVGREDRHLLEDDHPEEIPPLPPAWSMLPGGIRCSERKLVLKDPDRLWQGRVADLLTSYTAESEGEGWTGEMAVPVTVDGASIVNGVIWDGHPLQDPLTGAMDLNTLSTVALGAVDPIGRGGERAEALTLFPRIGSDSIPVTTLGLGRGPHAASNVQIAFARRLGKRWSFVLSDDVREWPSPDAEAPPTKSNAMSGRLDLLVNEWIWLRGLIRREAGERHGDRAVEPWPHVSGLKRTRSDIDLGLQVRLGEHDVTELLAYQGENWLSMQSERLGWAATYPMTTIGVQCATRWTMREHTVDGGMRWEQTEVSGSWRGDKTIRKLSSWLEDRWRPSSSVELHLGSGAYIERGNSLWWLPRCSLRWSLSNRLSLTISGSRSITPSSLAEEDPVANRVWSGRPDLPPQAIWTARVGSDWKASSIALSVVGFRHWVHDLRYWSPTLEGPQSPMLAPYLSNGASTIFLQEPAHLTLVHETDVHGVEVNVQSLDLYPLTVGSRWVWMDGDDTRCPVCIPHQPCWWASGRMELAIGDTSGSREGHLWITGRHMGERWDPWSGDLPASTTVDLGGSLRLIAVVLFSQVHNLFNGRPVLASGRPFPYRSLSFGVQVTFRD